VFEVGQKILDVYIIEKFLGAGGAGEVFLVRRDFDDARYAVKTLLSGKTNSLQLRQDLLREIRVSQSLSEHPNIVASRFFRVIDGQFAVFSDYVSGGSLSSWIRSKKIKSRKIFFDIAIQLAWGLGAAHEGGIIHKDIKAANILMEPDGCARIADFGLIRGMTPAFASPEQSSEQPLTFATDIYSWALLVMLMWFGKRIWTIGALAPNSLKDLRDDKWFLGAAPESLITLLGNCLALDPGSRPQSALYLADQMILIYEKEIENPYTRAVPSNFETPSTDSNRTDHKSVIDGLEFKDPKLLLEQITQKLKKSSVELSSLVPELEDPASHFVDDLHSYLFIEDILKRLTGEGDPEWMDIYHCVLKQKAWVLFDAGDLLEAAEAHGKAIEALTELILWHDRQDLWFFLSTQYADRAFCYIHAGKPQEAQLFIQQAIKALNKVPDDLRDDIYYNAYHIALIDNGIIQAQSGNADEATKSFQASIEILENTIDKSSHNYRSAKASGEFNLATHYQKLGKVENSFKHFKNALDEQTPIAAKGLLQERLFLSTICLNLAVSLADFNRLKEANLFMNKTQVIFDEIIKESDHVYVQKKYAHFLRNKAMLLSQNKQRGQALVVARQALTIALKLLEKKGAVEYRELISTVYLSIAEILNKLDRKEESDEALALSKQYDAHIEENK